MRCPTLRELPPPPPGKTGWPWTEETQPIPDTMPDGGEWPKISIVTPNYNYGQFIEETIRSVLLQGYPNLEYIVIDGGSTDDSVEIIKKYEPWLSYWVSEKDKGQSNAINKGFEQATGLIFNWINSDDVLCRNSLQLIAEGIQNADAFGGAVLNFHANHQEIIKNQNLSAYNMILHVNNTCFQQPGLWLRRILVEEIGRLKEEYNYCFDWDLTIKYLSLFSNINYTDAILAKFRLHSVSKTVNHQDHGFDIERDTVLKKMIQEQKYAKIHSVLFLRLRQKSWNQYVTLQLNKSNKNRIYTLVNILFFSCLDPKIRWNRFTLGAAKRIILT
jgi:glycosyltransferase involved in cell wall biosynthesis